jgi:hypothetical protein
MLGDSLDLYMHYRSKPRSHQRVTTGCLSAASRQSDARVFRCFALDNARSITVQTPGQVPSGSNVTDSSDVLASILRYGSQGVGHKNGFVIYFAKITHLRIINY